MANNTIKFLKQSFSYFFVSALAYIVVFVSMILFVNLCKFSHQISFFFSYTLAYFFDYIATCKIVFKQKHSNHQFVKYLIYLVIFFGLANLIFFLLEHLGIHYLLETFGTILILFPLRFFVLRNFVFI